MHAEWRQLLTELDAIEDDEALGRFAAGWLESAIHLYDDLIVDLLEHEASSNPKLRRALTGVGGPASLSDGLWQRIRAIQRTVPDPFPDLWPPSSRRNLPEG
jgi:hypothetical protein